MLLFCPTCSNILTVSPTPVSSSPSPEDAGLNRLECLTCPYQYILQKAIYDRKTFKREEKEDVFGGPGMWDNADKTEKQCTVSDCDGMEATVRQVQIRSADEPMTSFFRVSEVFVLFGVLGVEERGVGEGRGRGIVGGRGRCCCMNGKRGGWVGA
ncbi:dna-directed RNA polymerase iii subunit rpc10 protein [Rutstroemia sp. NJR-2017a WRK4]|nr:dna-directed RNA polymerase iii subunit rpc10 protein [Rutstroemia sp. NJR-2017a WRK4]